MDPCADLVDAVMGAHFELGARAPHLDALGIDRDDHARGRCGFVGHVDMGAETPLALVEMRLKQLHAGPFHQPDHEAGGEHLRHGGKL